MSGTYLTYLTLPDSESPFGAWVMRLASMLGVDYDANAISHAVSELTGHAATGHPGPRDDGWEPDPDSAFGQHLAHLANFLGCEGTPDAVARAVWALADRADDRTCASCGHPITLHDGSCGWCDNRRGGALCGCTRVFSEPQSRKRLDPQPTPTDLRPGKGEQPPREPDATPPTTVYVAQVTGPVSGQMDVIGVSATPDGALAFLGARWLEESESGHEVASRPEHIRFTLDDPRRKTLP